MNSSSGEPSIRPGFCFTLNNFDIIGIVQYGLAKEETDLTDEERFELQKFGATFTALSDGDDICDKEGIMYIIKIFQYEFLGKPLGLISKELINALHHEHSKLYILANDIAQQSYNLYLNQ